MGAVPSCRGFGWGLLYSLSTPRPHIFIGNLIFTGPTWKGILGKSGKPPLWHPHYVGDSRCLSLPTCPEMRPLAFTDGTLHGQHWLRRKLRIGGGQMHTADDHNVLFMMRRRKRYNKQLTQFVFANQSLLITKNPTPYIVWSFALHMCELQVEMDILHTIAYSRACVVTYFVRYMYVCILYATN